MDGRLLTNPETVLREKFGIRVNLNNPFLHSTRDSCPIQKLPVDILSYLFEIVADGWRNATTRHEVLTDEVLDNHKPSCNISKFMLGALTPWLPVSQVCRYWHDIAISTPSLWAVIHIPFSTRSRCPPFRCVATQLERSKGFPLDIRINLDRFCGYPSIFFPMVFNTLLAHIHRWRSIEVQVAKTEHMYEILDAISKACISTAPQLASVVLICHGNMLDSSNDYIKSKRFMLFGGSAPHLKTISLIWVNIDWNQLCISSASNLMTLEINVSNVPSWTQFATILRGAPNLQVLVFNDDTWHLGKDVGWNDLDVGNTHGDNGTDPIRLPKLRQLHISLPNAMAVQIYRKCHIPTLKKLTISSYYHNSQEVVDALVAQLIGPQAVTCPLASKSSEVQLLHTQNQSHSLLASVEQLHINHRFQIWSTKHIDSIYCIANQLTSLSLGGPHVPAFIDLLFTPTGQLCDAKLPRLKTLSVSSPIRSSRVRHICALAWHRKDMNIPLRTIIFMCVWRGTFPKDCLLWFQENLETFYCNQCSYCEHVLG
ncbi:hypothetical protein JVT61DRAFT_11810 [Boletus reticuloceps]|uniref:F-box domain-containing protein n=1 Tax=Boletus reticuloceps TaxID=495285 RepID=A0A8I2YYK0_9AGAM|nr:hypothetical protein JVT61DRAFT_11810 [Boletus reticuloceps]